MKVLADFHHAGLYNSLHLLFEKRLGYELYRPIGKDWVSSGFWRIAEPYGNHPSTIAQYLGTEHRVWNRYEFLNGDYKLDNENVYHIYDPENNIHHRAVTFETFKEMEFDLIIGSHPLHDTWEALLQYQPKAKFIMQIGNESQKTSVRNILCSVWAYHPIGDQKIFYYHQEFDRDIFYPSDPINRNRITSFVMLLPDKETFLLYKAGLSEYEMKAYGMGNDDGTVESKKEIGNIMRDSVFGWHIKPADGYGHILHNWYACGRPVITRGSFYLGKTGGLLLEDQITCIDIDRHSFGENLDLIRKWSEPENHNKLCQNASKRFNDVVDFDREAEGFKSFLSNVI